MSAKRKIQISGSLSCIDLLHIQDQMEQINQTDLAFLHYDVVDGKFNDCFVFGDLILEKIRPLTKKPIVVHLAVEDVEPYIKPMIKAGADYIAVHYETPCDHIKVFEKIRSCGAKPILAFRCETAVPDDFEVLASQVESILKLTVNPGYAGQPIQKQALDHIRCMKDRLDKAHLDVSIEADGNINTHTIPEVVKAGARILTGGTSGLFNDRASMKENYDLMMEAAQK